jgi:hypothetical protein
MEVDGARYAQRFYRNILGAVIYLAIIKVGK